MLIFSTIFRVKIRKIPYSCNNSVSIEDTAVQFANSRRFSDIADRMFFTTAILLHDRKWPRPPIITAVLIILYVVHVICPKFELQVLQGRI